MPNWCHNTLTVEGKPADVRAFAEAVQTEQQPLTFAAHVPEPSEEVYAAMNAAKAKPCDLCGATGVRPGSRAEAIAIGARWDDSFDNIAFIRDELGSKPRDQRPKCNVCDGTGTDTPHDGWYGWRIENWGTKWDAHFDGPFGAMVAPGGDVSATVDSEGLYLVAGTAIYNFDTAWGPPVAWLQKMAPMVPWLKFTLRYAEMGMDFAGEAVAKGARLRHVDLAVDDVLSPEQMWY